MASISEESQFLKKLSELGLRAQYSEETKNDYGITLHRFWISIYKGKHLLEKTSSGFVSKNNMYETGYMQANRKLTAIEMNGTHKKDFTNQTRSQDLKRRGGGGDGDGPSGSRYDSYGTGDQYVERFN